MANDLLYVYSSPGAVDLGEFTDWYDNEHVPARIATPGFGAIARYRAADGAEPEWLATYDIAPGTLESDAYRALPASASDREKRIMSTATLDRRVYTPLSDSWAAGHGPGDGAAPALLSVSMSVPDDFDTELDAYYSQEHYPLLLAVPGWRRARRFKLAAGDGLTYLSLHEIDSLAALEDPAYKKATSTPWYTKVVASRTARQRRVFTLHKSFA